MDQVIIFLSTGLLVYWASRSWILLHASEEVIDATLDRDLQIVRSTLSLPVTAE